MEFRIDTEKLGQEIAREIIKALGSDLFKGDREPEKTEKEILGVQDLADYLGVTRDTIYKKVALYEIPFFKIGDLTKFKKSDINRWIDDQTRAPIPSLKVVRRK
jgi:excisionase family DNA binding protein